MADGIVQILLNAIFTGVGVTIGTYVANKVYLTNYIYRLVSHLEKLVERMQKIFKNSQVNKNG